MKEESSNPSDASGGAFEDVISLLQSMQQQLAALEKKIDLLMGASHKRNAGDRYSSDRSFRKGPHLKQSGSFGRPQRHGKGEHKPRTGERNSPQEPYYERRPHQKNRGQASKKKHFGFSREDRE